MKTKTVDFELNGNFYSAIEFYTVSFEPSEHFGQLKYIECHEPKRTDRICNGETVEWFDDEAESVLDELLCTRDFDGAHHEYY